MKNKEIEEYLNLINFSLITDKYSLSNVYEEIGSHGSILALSPLNSNNLEKLIIISNSELLIKFYKSLDHKLLYKKLGSRIIESIFKRLFECMYILNEEFLFEEIVESINFNYCVRCKNATHVLRHVIMLLTGKKIEKFNIKKYQIKDKLNIEYSKKKIELYKIGFSECIKDLHEEDTLVTYCNFIQAVKSQSLIKYFYEIEFSFEKFNKFGFIYDGLIRNSNKSNLQELYNKIKYKINDIKFIEKNNYCLQSFIKRYKKPLKIFKKLKFNKYEKNSNIILSLLEALQENKNYKEVKQLINEFYNIKTNVFSEFLLNKENGLNSKYIKMITNFMKMPKKYSFEVNEDFLKYFEGKWLSTKSGIELIIGYAAGNDGTNNKKVFFNKNIDKLWNSVKWNEGKEFIKQITNYTNGHARKKAFEILNKF